jgi:hypothetical protein
MKSDGLYSPFCVTTTFALGATIGLVTGEIDILHKFIVLAFATTTFHIAHTYSRKKTQ